jgi:hypothetical protein
MLYIDYYSPFLEGIVMTFKKLTFEERSPWVIAYGWCGRLLRLFRIKAGYNEPTDLCTLVQSYVLAALVGVGSLIALALVTQFLIFGVTEFISEYNFARESSGKGILEAIFSSTVAQVVATITLFFMALISLIFGINLAVAGYESDNAIFRCYGIAMKWLGFGVLWGSIVILGLCFGIVYCIRWPFAKLASIAYHAIKKTRPAKTGPNFLQIAGQWLYGQMHGICFQIEVKS